jgi:hypothetical protein
MEAIALRRFVAEARRNPEVAEGDQSHFTERPQTVSDINGPLKHREGSHVTVPSRCRHLRRMLAAQVLKEQYEKATTGGHSFQHISFSQTEPNRL